jgi:hypothetical protein
MAVLVLDTDGESRATHAIAFKACTLERLVRLQVHRRSRCRCCNPRVWRSSLSLRASGGQAERFAIPHWKLVMVDAPAS